MQLLTTRDASWDYFHLNSCFTGCPPSYDHKVNSTNSCYFITNDTRLDWFGGLAYCSLNGGHLLVIEDEAELDYINSHFIEIYGSAWIGLSNLKTEGKVTQHSTAKTTAGTMEP